MQRTLPRERARERDRDVPTPEQMAEPRVDGVHEDLSRDVGPDAEPPLTAETRCGWPIDEPFADGQPVAVDVFRGTRRVATITVRQESAGSIRHYVSLEPSRVVLEDDVVEEVVSALSLSTQRLIEFAD
ncbi:hypothetical protein SAMN05216388_10552 [Halorientalis persicus]|uniref:Uncharacterized protein n=1 Tax=Halorientalis persicus TaxID=1367881 RepID=A0A1H8WDR9_9EURY|nr:hypothetical protein [Halorientalis persicus]SEP25288.1 hypothetical protein SAMN05216388_10552 [Halorientalis persicus]